MPARRRLAPTSPSLPEADRTPNPRWLPLSRRLPPGTQRHEQSVAGPQGDPRLGFHGMTGDQSQAMPLSDHGQDHQGFHHCEILPDALSLAAAEGKIGMLRTASRALREKAFGIEL